MNEDRIINLTPEEIKDLREQCHKKLDVAHALERLQNNADFKLVFMEGYSKDEPVRLIHLLGEPSINFGGKKDEFRGDLTEQMYGIARFAGYCRYVFQAAEQARKTLDGLTEAEIEYYQDKITK